MGHRQDHGLWDAGCHPPDDQLGESAALPGGADQDGRPQARAAPRPWRTSHFGSRPGVRLLDVTRVGINVDEQSVLVDTPQAPQRPAAIEASRTIASHNWSAIPMPAVPAPKTTTGRTAPRCGRAVPSGRRSSPGQWVARGTQTGSIGCPVKLPDRHSSAPDTPSERAPDERHDGSQSVVSASRYRP